MSRHMAAGQHSKEKLKHNSKDKILLLNKYAGYSKQFVDMFTEFQFI